MVDLKRLKLELELDRRRLKEIRRRIRENEQKILEVQGRACPVCGYVLVDSESSES